MEILGHHASSPLCLLVHLTSHHLDQLSRRCLHVRTLFEHSLGRAHPRIRRSCRFCTRQPPSSNGSPPPNPLRTVASRATVRKMSRRPPKTFLSRTREICHLRSKTSNRHAKLQSPAPSALLLRNFTESSTLAAAASRRKITRSRLMQSQTNTGSRMRKRIPRETWTRSSTRR